MVSDTFLETASICDLLADHPQSIVINKHGFYFVDENKVLHTITLSETEYNSIRHTLISTLKGS